MRTFIDVAFSIFKPYFTIILSSTLTFYTRISTSLNSRACKFIA